MNTLKYFFIFVCCWEIASCISEAAEDSVRVMVLINRRSISGDGKFITMAVSTEPKDEFPTGTIINYKYETGDVIDFSCHVQPLPEDQIRYFNLVHQWNGVNITIPPEIYTLRLDNDLNYTITANEFDSDSKVYCMMSVWNSTSNNYIHYESAPLTLIMNSGKLLYNPIREIHFRDNPTNDNCIGRDDVLIARLNEAYYTSRMKQATPSGSNYFCKAIRFEWSGYYPKRRMIFIREINDTTNLLHTLMRSNETLNLSAKIGICVGVLCVVLVASCLLLRYRRRKRSVDVTPPSNQDNRNTERVGRTELQVPRAPAPLPAEVSTIYYNENAPATSEEVYDYVYTHSGDEVWRRALQHVVSNEIAVRKKNRENRERAARNERVGRRGGSARRGNATRKEMTARCERAARREGVGRHEGAGRNERAGRRELAARRGGAACRGAKLS